MTFMKKRHVHGCVSMAETVNIRSSGVEHPTVADFADEIRGPS